MTSPAAATSVSSANSFPRQVCQFILALCLIQSARALLTWAQWRLFHPGNDPIVWNIIDIVSYTVVGLALLILFRPSPRSLGLFWDAAKRIERIIYLGMFLLVVLLVVGTLAIAKDLFLENLKAVFLLPLFEEPLFRGWGWQKIESSLSGRYAKVTTWLCISVLFGLWHLGYMDIYLLKVLPVNPEISLPTLLVMKVLTTLVLGLAFGFVRLKTGKLYGSLLLHAFVNLFGR